MIDNFEHISRLLTFHSEDEFYFVQILQRKKDNKNISGSNNSNRLICAYYITSVEQLFTYKNEMITLADAFNARIGINLNKRSFEKTALNTLKKIAEQIHNRDYYNVRRAYNTACGIHNAVDDKLWILDVDVNSLHLSYKNNSYMIIDCVNSSRPYDKDKFIAHIPSKNGYHIITRDFHVYDFNQAMYTKYGINYSDILEIHKNNPTNLYIP